MGFTFDDINNPGLVLGLGFSSSTDKKKPTGVKPEQPVSLIFEPSLTLSLSGDAYEKNKAVHIIKEKKVISNKEDDHDLCRQDSVVSTISNVVVDHVSIKRERSEDEVVDDDVDVDDDGNFNARKKLRLTKAQSAMLEESFKHRSTLNPKQKQELAKELNLRPRQVEVWFQNRRARTKLKQTEVDCELLKKCCETLTEENRRLQKEVQELKAMKGLTNPFYMQLPAAPGKLTMCPSCERIAGVVGEKASKITPFNMAPKHHLLNPFATHPAAC